MYKLKQGLMVLALGGLAWTPAWGAGLRLLTEELPPFNTRLADGRIGGLSTQLLRELFRRADIPYSIELQPWVRAFNTTRQEHNTCVYSTIRNASRERQFKWVGPLVVDPWVLYGGPHSPRGITSLEKARKSKIGDYLGDAEAQYLLDRGFHVELAASNLGSMKMLVAGRVDFWATSLYVGHALTQQYQLPQLKPVLQFYSGLLYLACHPNVPTRTIDRLNTLLQDMENDGFSERVRKSYLTPP